MRRKERLRGKPLTKREFEVAQGICAGQQTKDIANSLSMAPKTVSSHRDAIYCKLGVDSNVELIIKMLNDGKPIEVDSQPPAYLLDFAEIKQQLASIERKLDSIFPKTTQQLPE